MVKNIALIDDHPLILRGMEIILSSMRGYRLGGKYLSCSDFYADVPLKRFDLIIADTVSGHSDDAGGCLIEQLHQRFPKTPLLAFSEYAANKDFWAVMRAGARGYVSKSAEADELCLAISETCAGRVYVPSSVRKPADPGSSRRYSLSAPGWKHYKFPDVITRSEARVLNNLIEGYSVKDISHYMERSIKTVSTHKRSAFRKLGVRTDCEFLMFLSRYFGSEHAAPARTDREP